jgi:hypothetical protein
MTDEQSDKSFLSIYLNIWTSPRKVFAFVKNDESNSIRHYLCILFGIVSALHKYQENNTGESFSLLTIILLSIIGGGLFGWLGFYFYCFLIEWTGEWLNGKGRKYQLNIALSYAQIPFITSILVFVFGIIAFEKNYFRTNLEIEDYNSFSIRLYSTLSYIQYALSIWTFVLMIIAISEVQRMSIGKAILNLFLPVLIIAVPITLGLCIIYIAK